MNKWALSLVVSVLVVTSGSAVAGTFLVNEWNASTIRTWDSDTGVTSPYHTTRANDADVNVPQGSTFGWIAEHFFDDFARFELGSGSGLESTYSLGTGGRSHYAYPKHITVFNGQIIVMSRNDATIWRYDTDGGQLGSIATGAPTGQGMATDGQFVYVSIWDGATSRFQVYDAAFQLQGTIPNPGGMGGLTNLFDFAHDSATGRFFGLATNGEGGTGTRTTTVLEFAMGGSVVASHTLPIPADGIGQLIEDACGDGTLQPGEACDDGAANGTTVSCCSSTCTFIAPGQSCDDENACTLADTCDGAGACVGSDPVTCTALDQCHEVGTCDPTTGACSDPAKSDGSACDDGDACTLADSCQSGTCAPGEPTLLNPLEDPNQTVQCVEQTVGEALP